MRTEIFFNSLTISSSISCGDVRQRRTIRAPNGHYLYFLNGSHFVNSVTGCDSCSNCHNQSHDDRHSPLHPFPVASWNRSLLSFVKRRSLLRIHDWLVLVHCRTSSLQVYQVYLADTPRKTTYLHSNLSFFFILSSRL